MSFKTTHNNIINAITNLTIYPDDTIDTKISKKSRLIEKYVMIEDVKKSIQSKNLPRCKIAGNLDWSMSYPEIKLSIKNLFNKLMTDGYIISNEEFKKSFKNIGQRRNKKLFIDSSNKKWINVDNDITRVLGSRYINRFNHEIKASKSVIVCDLENIEINIEFNFRNINGRDIYEFPPLFPFIKDIKNGFIISEYIEQGIPVGTKLYNEESDFFSKIKYVDFKYDNILMKGNQIWVVDTEKFSFIWRPELLYFQNETLFENNNLNSKKYYHNLKLFDRKIVLYAAFKFLNDNNNFIINQSSKENDENGLFNFELLKCILIKFSLK